MELVLIILLIISVIVIAVLGIALLAVKSEIRTLSEQIEFISENDTNMEVTTGSKSKSVRRLSLQINTLLKHYKSAGSEIMRQNKTFRENITSISHDLRTPLTAASGYIQMLCGDISDEKRREYVGVISQKISAVQKMLEQLFEFSRIEADELTFECERMNVNNLLRDVIILFFDRFQQKGIEPDISIPETPCYINGNADMLERTVSNIVSNALIHGGDDFSLKSEEINGVCGITFKNRTDTVSEQDISQVFERFYTTDKSRNKKTTGLGLSIAKKFVTKMGGKISASLDNGFFCITIEFPTLKPLTPIDGGTSVPIRRKN